MAKKEKNVQKNRNIPDIIPEELTFRIPLRLPQHKRETLYMNYVRAQSPAARVLELESDAGRALCDAVIQLNRYANICQKLVWKNPAKGFNKVLALQDYILGVSDRLREMHDEDGIEYREPESIKKIRVSRNPEEATKELAKEA